MAAPEKKRLYAEVLEAEPKLKGEASRTNLAGTERIIRLFGDTPENQAALKKASKDGKVLTWDKAFALARASDKRVGIG